jgi:sugar lactone lactonase YvrE
VVVCSIESVNEGFYKNVGISGYMYLEKIVQLPFSIPELTAPEKKAMLRGFLTGKHPGTRDYTQISVKDVDTIMLEEVTEAAQVGYKPASKLNGEVWARTARRGPGDGTKKTYPIACGFLDGMVVCNTQKSGAEMWNPNDGKFLCELSGFAQERFCEDNGFCITDDRQIYACNVDQATVFDVKRNGDKHWVLEEQHHYKPNDGIVSGVACSDSFVFVATLGNNIHRYDRKDKDEASQSCSHLEIGGGKPSTKTSETWNHTTFKNPSGMIVVENKYLLVCDRDNHRVVKMGFSGEVYDDNFGEPNAACKKKFIQPHAICQDPDGNVLVYDTGNYRVVVCSRQGARICSIMDPRTSGAQLFTDNDWTYCGLNCCPETGRLCVTSDNDHRLYIIKPYLYDA